MSTFPLFSTIESLCAQAEATTRISAERQETLKALANYLVEQKKAGQSAKVQFICTHNSRRSFFGQIWMAVAAARYGLDHVISYSGGTEATAMNPRVAASLTRFGFEVTADPHKPENTNPHYAVRFGQNHSTKAFSKRFDDVHNPLAGFCAVMVCTEADAACPFVPGADLRLKLPFVDPKVSDGTAKEAGTYDERSMEIAAHCLYAARLAAVTLAK